MPQDASGQCTTPVTLHVYHVGGHAAVRGLNSMLKPLGVGAFHAAVEVHGKEGACGSMLSRQPAVGRFVISCSAHAV